METIIHIVLLVMKFIVAWFIREVADMPLGKIKESYIEKAVNDKLYGKSTMPYLVSFGIQTIGCVVFVVIMIFVTCDYLDIFEKYLLSLLK